jgi:hypothetical protein
LYAGMKGGGVAILLGITAFVAYSLGHQNAPATYQPVALTSVPAISANPVVFVPAPPVIMTPASTPDTSPGPESRRKVEAAPPSATAASPDTSGRSDGKRKIEAALTAAAIAAIIVKVSRDQYYATGHPCACPDDSMRNGRACGGRSAYSRPGGAAPLCYPTDVTAAMIESYRQRTASR